MSKDYQKAYDVWQSKTLATQTIDDILSSFNISHENFRRWLRRHGLAMYRPTPGLAVEVLAEDLEPSRARAKYYLSLADVQTVFYRDLSEPMPGLDKHAIIAMVDAGKSNVDIAQSFGISEARVCQIKREYNRTPQGRKPHKRLRPQEKKELKAMVDSGEYSIAGAAEKLGIGTATAYRILKNENN